MFTPPPSPAPIPRIEVTFAPNDEPLDVDTDYFSVDPTTDIPVSPVSDAVAGKRRVARRTKWAVLLVPAVLVVLTASTRYFRPRAVVELVHTRDAPTPFAWHDLPDSPHRHKRQAHTTSGSAIVFPSTVAGTASMSASGGVASALPTPVDPSSQSLPTIPSSPPPLPTPFPQALDSLEQNFSTQSCFDFFQNMTSTAPFRSCRPFSLLLQSSSAFIEQAQNNLTGLNIIMYGVCNPTLDTATCTGNMAWFASALQSACSQDLKDQNQVATSTLQGLNAYPLMRQSGCTTDPVTNTYCYVEAAHNANPSDQYFFQLPLGVGLPSGTTPTCSACTKSLLAEYAPWAGNLTGLRDTYNNGASLASSQCGAGYAQTAAVSNRATSVRTSGSAVVLGVSIMLSLLVSAS